MAGDITRITLNVHKFYNSETIEGFSNEELGQYVRLMCKAILLGKEASLPDDRKILSKWADTTPSKLSEAVLAQYPVVLTEFGPRRRNEVLYEEWCRVCEVSETKSMAAQAKKDKKPQESPLSSTKASSICSAPAEQQPGTSKATGNTVQNNTTQNNTEQNNTEQNSTTNREGGSASDGVGALLDGTVAELAEGKTVAREPGTPGFFRKGQYPGTSPKAIWQHCTAVYKEICGDGAYLRYPNKHPDYPDRWAELCDAVSSDIIVPAFQLWVAREGKHIKTQWALSEFLKGDTPARYTEMISPRNELKPKVTPQVVEASRIAALEADLKLWDSTEVKTKEPGPEAF